MIYRSYLSIAALQVLESSFIDDEYFADLHDFHDDSNRRRLHSLKIQRPTVRMGG
jgi:hypothetical protein